MALSDVLKIVVNKTSVANVAGLLLTVGGLLIAYKTGEIELVKNLSLFAAGYLFGSKAIKQQ
jgi:hypothetical protein